MAVVLVTGSNSGFGLAIASAFAHRGDQVAAGMRRPERADALHAAVAGAAGELAVVPLDVTDAPSMAAAVEQVLDRFGGIDVLVNNAGISHIAALEDTPAATVERIFATNVLGPLELSRLVLAPMRGAGSGRIVNVTAIGAVLCTPYLAAYVGSKHALDAASAALDLEVRPFGIRVVSVLPGPFRTGIVDDAAADAADAADSESYRAAAGGFRAGLHRRMTDASDDLSAVVEAVIDAATRPSPRLRTVVASAVMSEILAPMIGLLDDLHGVEARRLGLVGEHAAPTV